VNGVQLESNVLLTDESMTPLSILPMQMPKSLDTIMGNYTTPLLTRINETVAISFEHMNETETSGAYDYTEFVYFVDLPIDLPQWKQVYEPEPERKSIFTRILEVI